MVLALLVPGIAARAVTFTASLDRPVINLGESATLSLVFDGGQPDADPSPGEVPNLQISYLGPSRQFSVFNGQASSSVTYNFRITPKQIGDYVIPSVTAEVSGQKLTSQPLPLKVLKPTAPPPEVINSGAQLAFMRLALAKKEVYVGETIVGQLQLFLHSRVRNIAGFNLTSSPEGFNLGKMVEGQRRQVQISNAVYTVIALNVAMTAVKAGTFAAGPITATAVLDVQTGNRRRDPFFEQFGMRDPLNMLGGGTEQQQVPLATESETVQLLPLPKENRPPSFNGAIGNYTLDVRVGPTNVTAGDPITVRIQVAGRGSIEGIAIPADPRWANFKTFPPTSKVETTDQLGLQGSKTFEQIVSPESADVKALPAIEFSFFDPERKQYQTLTHAPTPLVVKPGGAPVLPVMVGTQREQDNSPSVQDILPNKHRMGTLAQTELPLLQNPWFLALQGIPLSAFIAALVWRKRVDTLGRNPRLRRQREVALLVHKGLGQLRDFAKAKDSEAFFATVFRLLQERLGERLDVPASSITEAVLEERLRPGGASSQLLSELQDLFQTCNLARYAPVQTTQELEALIPKVENALRGVGELQVPNHPNA